MVSLYRLYKKSEYIFVIIEATSQRGQPEKDIKENDVLTTSTLLATCREIYRIGIFF
jgi:hypothetical protein